MRHLRLLALRDAIIRLNAVTTYEGYAHELGHLLETNNKQRVQLYP
jgi:hypothetical protein